MPSCEWPLLLGESKISDSREGKQILLTGWGHWWALGWVGAGFDITGVLEEGLND